MCVALPGARRALCSLAIVAVASGAATGAAQTPSGGREVPARQLPAPRTVSPELQRLLAAPIPETWNTPPNTPEQWRAFAAASDRSPRDPQPILERFGITS